MKYLELGIIHRWMYQKVVKIEDILNNNIDLHYYPYKQVLLKKYKEYYLKQDYKTF